MNEPTAVPTDLASLPLDVTKTHKVASYQHQLPLTCCRFDPLSRFVFAGAEDLNVYRWDLSSGRKMMLSGHNSWVRSMDFSPDGNWLYTAGWDGELHWWLTDDPLPRSRRMVRAHVGSARWVRVSPDGSLLATCGNDNMIRVWRADVGEMIAELAGHERNPYAVNFHPDGKHLVSQDLMGNVFIWDLDSAQRVASIATVMTGYDNKFAADMGGARDMRLSPDGRLVATAGITNVVNSFAGQQDPIIGLIDWEKRTVLRHLRPEDNSTGVAWGIRFHPDGYIIGGIAKQSGSGLICFWKLDEASSPVKVSKKEEKEGDLKLRQADKDPLALKPFHSLNVDEPKVLDCIRGIDLAADNRRLAAACFDGSLRIYQMTEEVSG
jgi:WD40 repeat protein